MVSSTFHQSKTIFQIEMYCMQCFLKSNTLKSDLSMIKIGELLRKLWSLRSCFLILPWGALTPQGIEGATKRDASKHRCAIQWCASRGWFIAHENWTSCRLKYSYSHIFFSTRTRTHANQSTRTRTRTQDLCTRPNPALQFREESKGISHQGLGI